jgi:hypothetical protein
MATLANSLYQGVGWACKVVNMKGRACRGRALREHAVHADCYKN